MKTTVLLLALAVLSPALLQGDELSDMRDRQELGIQKFMKLDKERDELRAHYADIRADILDAFPDMGDELPRQPFPGWSVTRWQEIKKLHEKAVPVLEAQTLARVVALERKGFTRKQAVRTVIEEDRRAEQMAWANSPEGQAQLKAQAKEDARRMDQEASRQAEEDALRQLLLLRLLEGR